MLTIKQSAKKIGVHWQTVRNYIDKGDLKSYKIGKLVKIQEEDLENFIKNTQETNANKNVNIEVELRYLVTDVFALEHKLASIKAEISYHAHIVDHWFIPNYIKDRAGHDKWFDVERGCGIRIREQDNGYTGKMVTSLEVKRLTKIMDHSSFLEAETSVENYEKAKTLLDLMDRKEFLTIDKNRVVYKYKNFKIGVDTIKNFGTSVEIEIVGNYTHQDAILEIKKVAKKLGLTSKQLFDKSPTVSAMEKLADFS